MVVCHPHWNMSLTFPGAQAAGMSRPQRHAIWAKPTDYRGKEKQEINKSIISMYVFNQNMKTDSRTEHLCNKIKNPPSLLGGLCLVWGPGLKHELQRHWSRYKKEQPKWVQFS